MPEYEGTSLVFFGLHYPHSQQVCEWFNASRTLSELLYLSKFHHKISSLLFCYLFPQYLGLSFSNYTLKHCQSADILVRILRNFKRCAKANPCILEFQEEDVPGEGTKVFPWGGHLAWWLRHLSPILECLGINT